MKSWQRLSSSSVRDPGLDERLDHVRDARRQAPGRPHFVLFRRVLIVMFIGAAWTLFPISVMV